MQLNEKEFDCWPWMILVCDSSHLVVFYAEFIFRFDARIGFYFYIFNLQSCFNKLKEFEVNWESVL